VASSSKEAWTWEPQTCAFCDKPTLKSQSTGHSFAFKASWHTECGAGPK
jgi:hypothetical protein